MHTYTVLPAETQRQAALSALQILDTAPEDRFDHITGLARRVFGVPMAAITFIDVERQWVKSGVGIESGLQIPRQQSFCQYTIEHESTMVVENALTDARFRDIPLVDEEPMIRFYAGHPLHAPTGERVGSLCIADIVARQFTTLQCEILADLALLVEHEIARTPPRPAPPRCPVSVVVPQVPDWQITGRCAPDRQALGGFYDWSVSEDHVHLRTADVTGRPLTVTEASTWVETLLPAADSSSAPAPPGHRHPGDHCSGPAVPTAGFLTAFAGSLSRNSGHLSYVNPGYGLALVLQPDGGHRRLESSGVPLGIPAAAEPQINTTVLAPGEVLVVLSDGFLELQAPSQRAADRELTRIRGHYPQRLTVHDAVDIATSWAVAQGHPDDITVLAVIRDQGESRDHADPPSPGNPPGYRCTPAESGRTATAGTHLSGLMPQRLNEIRRFYGALIPRLHRIDAPLVGIERAAVLTLMGELLEHAETTTGRRNRPDSGEDGASSGRDGMQ